MAQNNNNLIWIDLEMTGLDTFSDYIIEIATIITDGDLNILEEGPSLVIHQHDEILDRMDDWNTNQHGKTGLIDRVKASTLNEGDAEKVTLEFLRKYVGPNKSPMCGNSICQDRRFLARCMPDLEDYFHYRNLDVSSIKLLAQRWAPSIPNSEKSGMHLAMDDVRDSINELKHYREHFFKLPENRS